jgi:hypothetical protein
MVPVVGPKVRAERDVGVVPVIFSSSFGGRTVLLVASCVIDESETGTSRVSSCIHAAS